MALQPAAQAAYGRWWTLALAAVDGGFTSSDTLAAAADIAKQQGQPLSFQEGTGITQLYSMASNIIRAQNTMASSPDNVSIDASMIGQAPWARSEQEQTASPLWYAQVQTTYVDPEGNQMQGWQTVMIPQVLPSSVGSLRAQLELRVSDMLAAPTTGSPTQGQLVSVDTIRVMAA